jgi:hypothetical protein
MDPHTKRQNGKDAAPEHAGLRVQVPLTFKLGRKDPDKLST